MMHEITFITRVSVRNNAEACVSRIMRETWWICNRMSLIGSYSLPSVSFVTLEKIVLIKKVYGEIN